jgi:1,6-anhydro-N-acetylmuramate kinase
MLDEQFKKYITERQLVLQKESQQLELSKIQEAQQQLVQSHHEHVNVPEPVHHIPEHVQTFVQNAPASQPSKGLGDTIEKIAEATGIKTLVDTVAKAVNKDCGCAKRKAILNEVFPYNQRQP